MSEKQTRHLSRRHRRLRLRQQALDQVQAGRRVQHQAAARPGDGRPVAGRVPQARRGGPAEFISKDAKKAKLIAAYALHAPGADDVDAEGNATGLIAFQFKQTAIIKPKDPKKQPFETKIGLFDAKGKPMPADVLVGRGSKVKVAYEVVPFCMPATKTVGVSLRLKAVQVLDLKRYSGGQDAAGYGFGAEEGYTADESTPAPAEGGEQAPAGDAPADGSEF
jgi:hypothetical protein